MVLLSSCPAGQVSEVDRHAARCLWIRAKEPAESAVGGVAREDEREAAKMVGQTEEELVEEHAASGDEDADEDRR